MKTDERALEAAALTDVVGEDGEAEAKAAVAGMFGRGLIFVAVWSFQIVVTTVASPILTHLLGPASFGRLASAIALHQVLIVVAVLGLDRAIILTFAEEDAQRARSLLTASLVAASAVTLVVGLSGPLWSGAVGFGGFHGVVVPAVLWTAPAAACQACLALLRAQDRLAMFSLVSVLSSVGGQALGIVAVLTWSPSATTYAWAGVITQCVAAVIGVAACRPRARGVLDGAAVRRAVTIGFPLTLGALAVFVLNSGDRLIIQARLGAAAVGRYQVAYTVGSLGILLLTYLNQSWEPAIYAVRHPATRWRVVAEVRDRSLRMVLPLVLALIVGAPIALRIFAPPSFSPARLVTVVAWVAMAAVPSAVVASGQRVLISLHRTRTVALAALVAAAANIGLNLALVPTFGITGSAAATLAAFALEMLVLAGACRGVTPLLPLRPRIAVELGVTAVAAVASTWVSGGTVVTAGRWAVCAGCGAWLAWHLRDVRSGRSGPSGRTTQPEVGGHELRHGRTS